MKLKFNFSLVGAGAWVQLKYSFLVFDSILNSNTILFILYTFYLIKYFQFFSFLKIILVYQPFFLFYPVIFKNWELEPHWRNYNFLVIETYLKFSKNKLQIHHFKNL